MRELDRVKIILSCLGGGKEELGPYLFCEAKALLKGRGFGGGPQFFRKREERVFLQAEIIPLGEEGITE